MNAVAKIRGLEKTAGLPYTKVWKGLCTVLRSLSHRTPAVLVLLHNYAITQIPLFLNKSGIC